MRKTVQLSSIEPNSLASIAERAGRGRLHWAGPLVLVCLRSVLLIAAQACVASLFLGLRHPLPWREAGDWWAVYGTLADLGSLAALSFFTRREQLRIRDLLGPIRMRHGHDLWLGLGYYLLIFPVFFGSTWLARAMLFPRDPGAAAGFLSRVHSLPLWAAVYGVGFWWMIWSPTEEATYQAYALPRIEALTRRRSVAMLLVGFWWAAQHCALPLIPDWRYLAFRFVSFFPGVLCLMTIYMRTRRLTPLIFAHWPMDIAGAIFHAIY